MRRRPAPVQLSIPLPAVDHRVFAAAQRRLQRILEDKAPSLQTLIEAQLIGRDVTGIVDEYLDRNGYAPFVGRIIFLRPARSVKRGRAAPLDPSRN